MSYLHSWLNGWLHKELQGVTALAWVWCDATWCLKLYRDARLPDVCRKVFTHFCRHVYLTMKTNSFHCITHARSCFSLVPLRWLSHPSLSVLHMRALTRQMFCQLMVLKWTNLDEISLFHKTFLDTLVNFYLVVS